MWLSHPGSSSLLLIQLAPAVLPLLEVSLEVVCSYGSETCCSILLSFFCRRKMMISESGLGPWEVTEVAWSEIWWVRYWRIAAVWFFTQNCCPARAVWRGTLSRCRTQFLIISLGFFPTLNGFLQTLREFQYKKWDLLCAALCALWLHFVVPRHCSPTTEIIILWFLMIFKSHIPVVHSGFLKSFVSINLTKGIMNFCCCVL